MKLIPNSVTRTIGRKILQTKKNSPHIFFVGGIVGVVGSTILACRATLKLEKTVDEVKVNIQDIETLYNNKQYDSEQDYYKELGYVYIRSAVKFGRLYAPSVALGSLSIAALTGSHIQLTRRNNALMITLASLNKAFDEYRIRVAEEIGEERELEIHRAINDEKRDIDGKKELVKVTDPSGLSPYARFFDASNPNWAGNAEYNRIFIQCQQEYANHLLNARGHVFLNDVYDQLGIDRSSAGAVVGWVRDGEGDNYIDFGMVEAFSSIHDVCSIILDFNVDGVIYKLIESK